MEITDILINAIVTGAGVSIGSYIATRGLIKSIEKVLGLGDKK